MSTDSISGAQPSGAHYAEEVSTTNADTLFPDAQFKQLAAQAARQYGLDEQVFNRLLLGTGANLKGIRGEAGSEVVQGIHLGLLQGTMNDAWAQDALPYSAQELLADPTLAFDMAAMHLSKMMQYSSNGLPGAVDIYLGTQATENNLNYVLYGQGQYVQAESGQAASNGDAASNVGDLSAPRPVEGAGEAGAVLQWQTQIQNAVAIVGDPLIDEHLLGGMVWAESSGNPTLATTNRDGSTDYGLMQISQGRFDERVAELRGSNSALFKQIDNKCREVLGVGLESLDITNPQHNLVAGALHLSMWTQSAGGDVARGLAGYVTGNINSDGPYPKNVLTAADELRSGSTQLSRDPHGQQTAEQNAAGVWG